MEEATELEWLRWFYQNADFGPADEDVRDIMKIQFQNKENKKVPKNYRSEDEDEEEQSS